MGDLHAISTKTRKPAWRTNIWKDFGGGAELPRWAIVQNPVIYGDLLIVAPQTSETGVVAYDKLTGAIKWKSAALSGSPGYVTPSIVKVAGEDQLVMITAAVGRGRTARDGSVNGLDPRSGKVLWTYTNWQCIIPVPQAVDAGQGRVLITGAYGAGTAMLQVDKKGDARAKATYRLLPALDTPFAQNGLTSVPQCPLRSGPPADIVKCHQLIGRRAW